MIITEETLLLQKRAGIITESQYRESLYELEDENKVADEVVDDVKDEMDAILKGMESELNKASTKSKPTNEGFLTIASVAIALPAILGLIARLGKAAGTMANKILGKKPSEKGEYEKWMNKLGHIADELHHLYLIPIESIVKKFIKDPDKAKKISQKIFYVIVATFLIASGVQAVQALQAKNLSLASLEGALSAIKSGEIIEFLGLGAEAASDVGAELSTDAPKTS